MSDPNLLAISASPEIPLHLTAAKPPEQTTKSVQLNINEIEHASEEEEDYSNFESAVNELDSLVQPLSIGLNVQRIDSLNRYYVELFDRETGEVLREIPSKKIIELQENLKQFQGILFDKFS